MACVQADEQGRRKAAAVENKVLCRLKRKQLPIVE
jgi:hypothetical protein